MSETRPDTTEIDAAIQKARETVRRLEGERHAAICAFWGIKTGDTVRSTRRGAEKIGIVAAVNDFGGSGRPWVDAFLNKKDGTPSAIATHLYKDWEKVDPTPEPSP